MKSFLVPLLLLSTLTIAQVDDYKLKAKLALDNAEKQVFKTNVDPKPTPAKECPCDGKGYIVQGDGHRSDCPGINGEPCKFKKRGAIPVVPKVVKSTPAVENGVIIMYTRPGCKACTDWLNNYGTKLLSVGWRIKSKPANEQRSVPYFGVIMEGKEYRMPGFLTVEKLNSFNSQFLKGK